MSSSYIGAIHQALLDELNKLLKKNNIEPAKTVTLSPPPKREFGDLATNLALRYAKMLKMPPMKLAETLAAKMQTLNEVSEAHVSQPGFINFRLATNQWVLTLKQILGEQQNFGRGQQKKQKVLVEYVSSNPTGPLHIGHGRGAAYGATLVNLLRFSGFDVDSEYYVNDAGRQMDILALSVWLRGKSDSVQLAYPKQCYQGDYVVQLAKDITLPDWQQQESLDDLCVNLPEDGDQLVDTVIAALKQGVGKEEFNRFQQTIVKAMIVRIDKQLQLLGVHMDNWFYESSLVDKGTVSKAIEQLEKNGEMYRKDNALWCCTSEYGDEKDRVVIRSNGSYTYFATDIAYHHDKYLRGYDRIIDIFGADHHGYIDRLKAIVQALGQDVNKLEFVINQLAVLWKGKEKLALSTRAGVFVDLDTLFESIGRDEARFMYLTQRHDQHLEFDLELAIRLSRDNPVYYVNYAYARAGQICMQAQKANLAYQQEKAFEELELLTSEAEQTLIFKLAEFPRLIERCAKKLTPHSLTIYARELAGLFHNYYASTRVIDEQGPYQARLALCIAVRQVIHNTLSLMDITPPEQM